MKRADVRKKLRARSYGARHRQIRRALVPVVTAGLAHCTRCGELIEPGEPWDLGTLTSICAPTPAPSTRAATGGRRTASRLRGTGDEFRGARGSPPGGRSHSTQIGLSRLASDSSAPSPSPRSWRCYRSDPPRGRSASTSVPLRSARHGAVRCDRLPPSSSPGCRSARPQGRGRCLPDCLSPRERDRH